jgi:hypothetical protein
MLKWRWQSALPNESLNCSLKMLLDYWDNHTDFLNSLRFASILKDT